MKQKIAIIGAGHIGGALARAWTAKGHSVCIGTRDPDGDEVKALAKEISARVESISEAPKHGDVVVLSVHSPVLGSVLEKVGSLSGKIVIDTTNALAPGMQLAHGGTSSAAEELAKRLPGAKVVKSFNTQGAEVVANPKFGHDRAVNFLCGDDAEAKKVVRGLVEDAGFEPVDAGPLKNARLIEGMTVLWISAAMQLHTRQLGLCLVRR
ncbi:MAG: NADPH-dependent F420 reductase [Deltaproteobacteria bacterium]|nr:NADPH-dependent F420 reductase [Deltaproteobacteria bacterium]